MAQSMITREPVSFRNADMAFFPFLTDADPSEYVIPEAALWEEVAGIALLKPIVASYMIKNAVEGKVCFPDRVPLGFSIFPLSWEQTPERILSYWNKLRETKRLCGHATFWNIVPPEVYMFILHEITKGKGRFYYHDPVIHGTDKKFLVSSTYRMKARPLVEMCA